MKTTMIISVFLYVALFYSASAVPEVSHLVQQDHSGNVISMDLIYDIDEKTVMAIIGDVSMYKDSEQTVNLHDYNTGYGVLKNINRRLCLLTKTPVPMATAEKYRMGYTTEVHYHRLKNFVVIPSTEKVQDIAGERIAAFCKDYITVSADPIPTRRNKRYTHDAIQDTDTDGWCVFSKCAYRSVELERVLDDAFGSR